MDSNELAAGHIPLAKRQAAKFCRDYNVPHLADEMESAALLGLARASQTPTRTAQFSSFAYACIRNELLGVLRTLNRQSKLDVEEMYRERGVCVRRIGGGVDFHAVSETTAEDRVAAQRILENLRADDRKLIFLHYFKDETFHATGQALGGLHKTTTLQRHRDIIKRLQRRVRQEWRRAA